MKVSGVLCQRARPKQDLEEKDDVVLVQIQEIPDLKPVPDAAVQSTDDEPEAVRQARIEARQWKELHTNYSDLPGIYARLSKIRLTGI